MVELDLMAQNLRYVLTQVENAATELSFALPARRILTVGGSVYDCEQVAISAMNSDPGSVSADPGAVNLLGACDAPWNVVIEVAIVVCAAEGITTRSGSYTAPTAEQIEVDTSKMSGAYAVLRTAVENIVTSGDVGTPSGRITFGQPQGGLIACVLTLNINTWFYDESLTPVP